MIATNRQVLLKSRPSGIPQAENFEIVTTPVPEPADGEVLVRNLYLSVEPAMRGWVSAIANYSEPVAIGAVMRSLCTGRVGRLGGYFGGRLALGGADVHFIARGPHLAATRSDRLLLEGQSRCTSRR